MEEITEKIGDYIDIDSRIFDFSGCNRAGIHRSGYG
jgi:hypothetical protein